MVTSTKGLGPEKDCAGKAQQHIQKTDPSSRQRGRRTENKTVNTKTYWQTDRQSQCDFDFDLEWWSVINSCKSAAVKRRLYVWYLEWVIQCDCYSSCAKIRCQETASGDCNRLRTLDCECQWTVKCSHEWWIYKRSINRITNPDLVYSQ
jgi:hypothetical protein